ncbi:MAG: FkbM family methyltransferase [Steroidobacteraceae bacterium]
MTSTRVSWLKRLSSRLPLGVQQELKRWHFAHQLRTGQFTTSEPEYQRLDDWVRPGDWVIDIGANVGHYALRLSKLVGPAGRVMAFEPVPETFEILASQISAAAAHNVSLFNIAASAKIGVAGVFLPKFTSGLTNYYMASLTPEGSEFNVLTFPLDALMPLKPITLVKMDVEGHELQALQGMQALLLRDRPRLIVEGRSEDVASFLTRLGYHFIELEASPNRVFERANSHQ